MASNFSRKALKQDKFAVEVEHTVDFFAAHRQSTFRYGGIALAVILIAAGIFYYRNSQHLPRSASRCWAKLLRWQTPRLERRRRPAVRAFRMKQPGPTLLQRPSTKSLPIMAGRKKPTSPSITSVRKPPTRVRWTTRARNIRMSQITRTPTSRPSRNFHSRKSMLLKTRPADAEKLLKDLMDHSHRSCLQSTSHHRLRQSDCAHPAGRSAQAVDRDHG